MADIQLLDEARCLGAMRQVAETWYGSAELTFQDVQLAKTRVVIERLVSSRIASAERVLRQYERAGLPAFSPVRDGTGTAHAGLLIEELSGLYMILDGTHRSVAAMRAGRASVRALVILPSHPQVPPAPLLRLEDTQEAPEDLGPKFGGGANFHFRPAARWLREWSVKMSKETL